MRFRPSTLLAALVVLVVPGDVRGEGVALLPIRQQVRDAEAVERVGYAVREEAGRRGVLIGAETTRSALRRLRMRAPESAPTAELGALAAELGADWLLSVGVVDVAAAPWPDVALAVRLYGGDGHLVWTDFVGRSGLDDRTVLGLGELATLEELLPVAVEELLAPWGGTAVSAARTREENVLAALGRVALLTFTATVPEDGVAVAGAATDATRAMLHRMGADLADPGCVLTGLRSDRTRRWGELSGRARLAVRDRCAVETVITGSIERWEATVQWGEPAPIVAVALRALDATSGRILWMGSRELGGADHGGLFGLRRVHSRGALLVRLLDELGREMGRELTRGPGRTRR